MDEALTFTHVCVADSSQTVLEHHKSFTLSSYLLIAAELYHSDPFIPSTSVSQLEEGEKSRVAQGRIQGEG